MKLKNAFFVALLLTMAVIMSALVQTPELSKQDQAVLKKLSQANSEEIQLGNLAQKKAASSKVKSFGKRMVDDHTKLEASVKQFAEKEGIQLPKRMRPEAQSEEENLAKNSGKAFDRLYIESMLKDHQKDITELQNAAEQTDNPQMKELLTNTVPILQNHIRVAEHVAGEIDVPVNQGLNQPVHPTG